MSLKSKKWPYKTRLVDAHPDIFAEIDERRCAHIDLSKITRGSSQELYWYCHKTGYSWKESVNQRVMRASLAYPHCSGCSGRAAIPGKTSLLDLHPEVSKMFDYENNKTDYHPGNLRPGSERIVSWVCENGHRWKDPVYRVVQRKKKCYECHKLYFTHPEIFKTLHPSKNSHINVMSLRAGQSKVEAWWISEKCGHEYKQAIASRVKGAGCPICSGHQLAPGTNTLDIIYPQIAKEFDLAKNYPLTPEAVYAGGNTEYHWRCENGHEWKSSIDVRRNRRSGKESACLKCFEVRSAAEIELAVKIAEHASIKENDRTIPGVTEVDIYIPSAKVAVEYNGLYWHSPERKPPRYHRNKIEQCLLQGIDLIHIWEDDWIATPELCLDLVLFKIGAAVSDEYTVSEIKAFEKRNYIRSMGC